jgi:hypothetical protein
LFIDLFFDLLWLRLQDDTLRGNVSSVDIATKKNLDHLVKVGQGLLKKPVSRVNLDTGVFEPSSEETNEEALIRYVRIYIRRLSN